jgi:hypothetical protein
VPFRAVSGMTIREFVNRCAKVDQFGLPRPQEKKKSVPGILMKETVAFIRHFVSPLAVLWSLFAKSTLKALKPESMRFVWDDKEKIFVMDSCSLAHVYFNIPRKRLNLTQINRKYPGLVKKLANNKHIGVVMAKQGEDIVLFSRGGRMRIKENSVKKTGKDFLKRFGNEELLVKQLRDFNKMRFMGDLTLFGNYENGVAVSFAEHVGAHGGIGGDMSWPFFISKKKYDLSKVTNAKELHKIFKEYK